MLSHTYPKPKFKTSNIHKRMRQNKVKSIINKLDGTQYSAYFQHIALIN